LAYQVIARKWRPQIFADVTGQEHVTVTLGRAIERDRVAHAYLFNGPRGVGKTTTARIFAKALNCLSGPLVVPCNECSACVDITRGNSLDVIEIDAASNRGIDEIRNLRDSIRLTPTGGRYKIFIIDEVHMLTPAAFNALLKTLEEPPAHGIFIMATTEAHKMPATILSRCQRFDFRSIATRDIVAQLQRICQSEKIIIAEGGLQHIAAKADGGMRDAQSLLDRVISYAGEEISLDDVQRALGLVPVDIFFTQSALIRKGDIKGLLGNCHELLAGGYDVSELVVGLEEHFRFLLIQQLHGGEEAELNHAFAADRYAAAADDWQETELLRIIQILQGALVTLRRSPQPKLYYEMTLLKLAKLPDMHEIAAFLNPSGSVKKKKAASQGSV
jgi:DNA polymerase-3 subunit gamma/tau